VLYGRPLGEEGLLCAACVTAFGLEGDSVSTEWNGEGEIEKERVKEERKDGKDRVGPWGWKWRFRSQAGMSHRPLNARLGLSERLPGMRVGCTPPRRAEREQGGVVLKGSGGTGLSCYPLGVMHSPW
jgi:hypothetical protein